MEEAFDSLRELVGGLESAEQTREAVPRLAALLGVITQGFVDVGKARALRTEEARRTLVLCGGADARAGRARAWRSAVEDHPFLAPGFDEGLLSVDMGRFDFAPGEVPANVEEQISLVRERLKAVDEETARRRNELSALRARERALQRESR